MNPRFCYTDDDLVRVLKEAWLLEIGSALNSDLPENWIALATRLGLSNDEIEQLRHVSNPGYEVLRRWRTRPNTTIRVLRSALNHMRRSDVIDRLEKAKTDPTDVIIVIRCNGQVHHLAEGGIPGLTTLLEFVRPQIRCKFSNVLAKEITCARLMLSPGSNLSWTSPIAEFRGQQIDVELFPLQRAQVRSAMELRSRQQDVHVERDCQSYMMDDLLVFDHGPRLPPRKSRTSVSPSPSSSSIEFDNQGPVQHPEDSQSGDFPSSPVSSPFPDENCSKLPGFHPEIPIDDTRRIKVDEVLEGHLGKNGAYILRRATKVNSVLALSVVYNGKVLHFSIMKSITGGSCNYFVFNSNSFSSVSELIAFYHNHSLSTHTMDIDTRGLLLTNPVS